MPESTSKDITSPPKLSVIMPVYNECTNLMHILEGIRAVDVEKEIIMVDDASTDGTTNLFKNHIEGKFPNVKVFYHTKNQGKGAAIRTAIPHAIGTYAIIQDGDLEYNPKDYLKILKAFEEHNATVVYGSRFTQGFPKMKLPNKIVNILLAWMVRFFFRTPMTDEATCYKAFRTDVLQSIPLKCKRFEFCPEITAKVIRKGHNIIEVPISYTARTLQEGKKIRWTDGGAAIWTLIKFRFAKF